MYGDKSAITAIGVVGPALGIIAYLLNYFFFKGEVVHAGDLQSFVDPAIALWTAATGIWGRIRATKQITGVVTPASKAP